jgi:hypothetical protein
VEYQLIIRRQLMASFPGRIQRLMNPNSYISSCISIDITNVILIRQAMS